MAEQWDLLVQLFRILGQLLGDLLQGAGRWSLLLAWLAWWLWGVNWKKVWPVLGQGAWVAVVLGMLLTALVWSRLEPAECACLGFVSVSNFWWQLGGVSLVVALTLFCGWLQGVFQWAPADLDLEPPAPAAHGPEHH